MRAALSRKSLFAAMAASALVFIVAMMVSANAAKAQIPPPGENGKITICHASGQAGTLKFETLELPLAGVLGHFDESGTPLAGHEQDTFGPCETETTDTTTATTDTTTTTTGA